MGRHHQIGHGEGELSAEGAGRVVDCELLWGDAGALHPYGRQGIADGHCYSSAGCGGQVEGAHFAVHRAVDHHITTGRN